MDMQVGVEGQETCAEYSWGTLIGNCHVEDRGNIAYDKHWYRFEGNRL
jgi:hypothetical protein